jgi:hypothetical protein
MGAKKRSGFMRRCVAAGVVAAGLTALRSNDAAFSVATSKPTSLEIQRGNIATSALATASVIEMPDTYASFESVPLRRASDGESVTLPSVWGNGKVVVTFLRHFG